jgi:hypothetical protein
VPITITGSGIYHEPGLHYGSAGSAFTAPIDASITAGEGLVTQLMGGTALFSWSTDPRFTEYGANIADGLEWRDSWLTTSLSGTGSLGATPHTDDYPIVWTQIGFELDGLMWRWTPGVPDVTDTFHDVNTGAGYTAGTSQPPGFGFNGVTASGTAMFAGATAAIVTVHDYLADPANVYGPASNTIGDVAGWTTEIDSAFAYVGDGDGLTYWSSVKTFSFSGGLVPSFWPNWGLGSPYSFPVADYYRYISVVMFVGGDIGGSTYLRQRQSPVRAPSRNRPPQVRQRQRPEVTT